MASSSWIRLEGGNAERLAKKLEWAIETPVIDDTGLTESFNAEVRIDVSKLREAEEQQVEAWRVAVEEQLGLLLVEDLVEIEFLVIEPRD